MSAQSPVPRYLAVLLQGRVAAIVRKNETGSHVMTYESAWRNDPLAFPLSLSLPLAGEIHSGPVVTYYLRGLLPDREARLNAIAHEFSVSPDDPFALLAHIGEDCPGAVQFARPERVRHLEGEGTGSIEWLSTSELATILRDLRASNSDGGFASGTSQFSLPGALAKIALVWDERTRRWGRPSGRAPTTHILKPPLKGVPHHNENEHLSLALANQAGCAAARSYVLHVEDESALVVERFDRKRQGKYIARLHQEDLSQALGVNPRLKYSAEGAPSIADAVDLLRDYASDGIDEVYRLLRAIAFNWIIAGTDAHPRNYSVFIGSRGLVRLTPLYDLASALVLPTTARPKDLPFAMPVAGQKTLGDIGRKAWETQARLLRLDPKRVIEELYQLALDVAGAAPNLPASEKRRGVDERFATRFASRVRARAIACARQLAK